LAYLEDLLKQIKLAGRSGGVFSSAIYCRGIKKAGSGLGSLVRDSEAALSTEFFPISSDDSVKKWAQEFVSREQ